MSIASSIAALRCETCAESVVNRRWCTDNTGAVWCSECVGSEATLLATSRFVRVRA